MGGQKRTRILHVIQNLHYGGMERLIAEMIGRIDRRRFETHVLGLQYLGRFSLGHDDLAQFHTGPRMSSWSMLRPSALARQIEDIAPDIVHSHSGVWYKASTAARMAGVARVIHTDHGQVFPISRADHFVDTLAVRRTDSLVAVSEQLGQHLSRLGARFASVVQVIENGVDTERFTPLRDTGAVRAELGIPPDVPILGSIGRLEAVKGFDIAIAALLLLRTEWSATGPAPVLVVAGDGDEMPRLRRQIVEAGLEEAVHLLSWRDDIDDLLSSFALFTMASHNEGTSVSLLEAMSAGLCPVVTEVGGNPATLGDDLAHRLVAPDSARALCEAWRSALLSEKDRRRDGGRARKHVVDGFSLDKMVAGYQRLYDVPP